MRRLIALLAPLPLLAATCGESETAAPGTGEVSAVAAVYPLAWVAEQVAPDADVSLLSSGGLEAHDLEITPDQRQAIETSDVALFVGNIGYQPQVEDAIADAGGEVVSLAEVAGPDRLLEPVEEAHADEGGEAGAGEAEGEDAGEEEATVDPHIWFNPAVMADAAGRTGEAFATADPDNAETYRTNAEELVAELAALEEELAEILGGECRHQEAIVSHQAYGYLLDPFGVIQHGVTGINPEAGASSGELGELVSEIEAEGFEYVLTEPVEGREGAETVAREAGVELLEITPLDAVTEDQAESGLVSLIREQAEQFALALGC
ncbi:MAG: metal ABC transporter substrate-binding protein [Actinomycetota bacterium]|jgi:zinc transport system substrate-binding protein|nr:metal ABC transporter substrate-binding protein [Actinomycetota bacterium]